MFLGPSSSQGSAAGELDELDAVFEVVDEDVLLTKVVECLESQMVVGWHHGRMEFGPRALGGRSILADPRDRKMQDRINEKVKFREPFRPFAPAVLAKRASDFFEIETPSPYMVFAAQLADGQKRESGSRIGAVTHVDDSARVQTVDESDNPRLHRLLGFFEQTTGCPVLLNTSFNLRGEPIVCSVEDSWICFMNSDIDVLVAENCLLFKDKQTETAREAAKRMLAEPRVDSLPRAVGFLGGLLRFNQRVQRFLLKLLFPIRYVVSNVVLSLVFLFCVLPIGLLRGLAGRTSFQAIDRSSASYWVSRDQEESNDKSGYFKQY